MTSTSASGRSSRESVSFRGQIRSVGNGAANNEVASANIHSASTATPASTMQKSARVCHATGRPLMEWSSESTLGASELVRRHRLHHHHHHMHHHHHLAATHPRHHGAGRGHHAVGVPGGVSASRKSTLSTRQVASADEASDSEEIDVCETCSEWLSKALLCSCQVPSSASSSPSQGQDQLLKQKQVQHLQQHQQQLQQRYQQQHQQRQQLQSRLVRP